MSVIRALEPGEWEKISHGFIHRGFKNREGPFVMRPFEWYPIDSPTDDLRWCVRCRYCGRLPSVQGGNCEGCGAPK